MKSLETILSLQPRVIYPGHGPVIENPIEVIQEYISHRQMREDQILATLKEHASQPLTVMELVKIIYKVSSIQRKMVCLICQQQSCFYHNYFQNTNE